MLKLILVVLALVFFIAAGLGATYKGFRFEWLGFACLTGAYLATLV